MSYDYLIVGAGSAGCVLANRLSANPNHRVALLEAGPADRNPLIHIPGSLPKLVGNPRGLYKLYGGRKINWGYYTEPQRQLEGRRLWWPRGKALGGSSSINAMCYIRGVPADYDAWAELTGDARWSWDNVLPWFLHTEDNSRGASALHGVGGPLGVSDLRYHSPLSDAFVAAGAATGAGLNADFNGPVQEGFGLYQVTQRNGARCSAADAYLRPIARRPNLEVRTKAMVERVLVEQGRAVGVQLRGGERLEAGEVILSGGALNSPQLLMLSGLGPADHLRQRGIAVNADLPGVGGNLQDHLDICTVTACKRKRDTYDHVNEVASLLYYYLWRRDGRATTNGAEAGGFVRSRYASDGRCDIQFHFIPAQLDDHGSLHPPGHGYTLHACYLHPRSRGRLRLKSSDPKTPVAIHANYLADPEGHDLKLMIEAARLSQEIYAQAALDPYRGAHRFPARRLKSDAEFAAFIRQRAETIYHPVGTCRMGRDEQAVVDSELRVHGVEGLRVIDASVMPQLVTGNTNAPTLMLAERGSALLLGQEQWTQRRQSPAPEPGGLLLQNGALYDSNSVLNYQFETS